MPWAFPEYFPALLLNNVSCKELIGQSVFYVYSCSYFEMQHLSFSKKYYLVLFMTYSKQVQNTLFTTKIAKAM